MSTNLNYSSEEIISFLDEAEMHNYNDAFAFYMYLAMHAKDVDFFVECLCYLMDTEDARFPRYTDFLKTTFFNMVDDMYNDDAPPIKTINTRLKQTCEEFVNKLYFVISFEDCYEFPAYRNKEIRLKKQIQTINASLKNEGQDHYSRLIDLLSILMNSLDNDNWDSTEDLSSAISYMLSDMPLEESIKIQINQVLIELPKLHHAHLLLGTFEYFPPKNDFKYSTPEKYFVTLYPKSIKKAHPMDDEIQAAKSTFIHEMFHAFHCYLYSFKKLWRSKRNKYRIVKESLASLYQYDYCKNALNNHHLATSISSAWNQYEMKYWPYSGAKYLLEYRNIKEDISQKIFRCATEDMDEAYSNIDAAKKIVESKEYIQLNNL